MSDGIRTNGLQEIMDGLSRAEHMEIAVHHYAKALDLSEESALDLLLYIPEYIGDDEDALTAYTIRTELLVLRGKYPVK